jgi:hypothetical protein
MTTGTVWRFTAIQLGQREGSGSGQAVSRYLSALYRGWCES